jgi:hypothetical protein
MDPLSTNRWIPVPAVVKSQNLFWDTAPVNSIAGAEHLIPIGFGGRARIFNGRCQPDGEEEEKRYSITHRRWVKLPASFADLCEV